MSPNANSQANIREMVASTAPTKMTPRNTRQATPHRMSPCLACQRTYSRRVTMNGTIARTQR